MKGIGVGIDLDGTLVDSTLRHKKVLFNILTDKGYSVNLSDLDDLLAFKRRGYSTKQYLYFKEYTGVDAIYKDWIKQIELNENLCFDTLYKDTIEALYLLTTYYSLHLVTARKNRKGAIDYLKQSGITKYFNEIHIVDPGSRSSERKANATKDKNIKHIIGDTEVDFDWAQSLGAKFYPVDYGFRDREWWEELYKIKPFSNIKEVVAIIIAASGKIL